MSPPTSLRTTRSSCSREPSATTSLILDVSETARVVPRQVVLEVTIGRDHVNKDLTLRAVDYRDRPRAGLRHRHSPAGTERAGVRQPRHACDRPGRKLRSVASWTR